MSKTQRERIAPNTFDISGIDHVPETGVTREQHQKLGGIPVVRTVQVSPYARRSEHDKGVLMGTQSGRRLTKQQWEELYPEFYEEEP